jgi:endonuclease/exonuclease/phosphatase family metal-dependent hydrolase
MGDFNVNQHSESYRILHESPLVSDSREHSPVIYGHNGTFNNFDPNAFTESRIDHIFLSAQFKPVRHGVLTDLYWQPLEEEAGRSSSSAPTELRYKNAAARLPSDHFPVLVEVED